MFDHESVTGVNPTTRDEQLANIRQIYPPEREALGVVAIGIELIDPPPVGSHGPPDMFVVLLLSSTGTEGRDATWRP
ncbi:MAG: hypothetical protein ACRDTE_18535 [Pseudonocardiaceae bacterium]